MIQSCFFLLKVVIFSSSFLMKKKSSFIPFKQKSVHHIAFIFRMCTYSILDWVSFLFAYSIKKNTTQFVFNPINHIGWIYWTRTAIIYITRKFLETKEIRFKLKRPIVFVFSFQIVKQSEQAHIFNFSLHTKSKGLFPLPCIITNHK